MLVVALAIFLFGFAGHLVSGMMIPTSGVLWLLGKQALRPTYYRLTPGRLEILQTTPLARRVWVEQRINLREGRLEVSFSEASVKYDGPGGTKLQLDLRRMTEPRRLAMGVLQAAVSTHAAPPLPDNALL